MHSEIVGEVNETKCDESSEEPDVPDQFRVHDDNSANWVVREIAERRAYIKRCAEWCAREQSRAKHEEEFFLYRFGSELQEYAKKKIVAFGGRRKSINLPAGTLGFRTDSLKLIIDDEPAVIAWALKYFPKAVTRIERLSKSDLNEHLKLTGEIPSTGAHIEPAQEKFYVK
jgi:hypothetical protein